MCTPLHLAAMAGGSDIIAKLLKAGADPNVRDGNGVCPLHGASMKGNLGAVTALLKAGADPDLKDGDGYSALHLARKYNHANVISHLEKVGKSGPARTKPCAKSRDRDGYVVGAHCGERALANWTCPKCGQLFCIACSGTGTRTRKDLGGHVVEETTIRS